MTWISKKYEITKASLISEQRQKDEIQQFHTSPTNKQDLTACPQELVQRGIATAQFDKTQLKIVLQFQELFPLDQSVLCLAYHLQ